MAITRTIRLNSYKPLSIDELFRKQELLLRCLSRWVERTGKKPVKPKFTILLGASDSRLQLIWGDGND